MAAPPLKVAVIGAGVGGLATARALKSVANHQIVVYEKSDRLGGTWVYDPRVESDPLGLDPNREIVHGSLYPSLCTNLPRQLMGFWDYPFRTRKNVVDSYYRTFPKHEEVLQFLIEFAEEFELTELIRFGSEVTRVERVDSRCDEWVVESRSNGLSSEEVFDAVIVCNGHHTQPRLAHLQGIEKWPGKQLHSHNYRGPELFQDKIVVVIGDGPSGIDISIEISTVAKQVYVSSRDPNITISKLDFKDNIWQHSKINCVHENGEVEFIDGASVFADIILHCTGFEYHMPFLKTDGIVTVDDNRVGPLYKHVFPPKLAPRLSFVGLTYRSLVVMTIDLQAKWVANVLSGKQTLPSEEEMLAETEQHYRQMEAKGIPKHHTHRIGHEHFFEYLDWLATEAGYAKVDEETKLITKNYFNFAVENGFWRAKEWAIE
ncbi:hypothetical protein RD792_015656 [Penstemon davidsonii]|uniref:Flavin-containing monooxygenase n=1 Tax=Penstemon davidsonii TaxID=160366 RepID=A0ABR0CJ18_9LAMI|nr:hypothetical protein RD792_015656 [Penstemon davidsonii]